MAVLDRGVNASTDSLQQVANTLSLAVSNMPGGKNVPRVTKVRPLYLVEGPAAAQEIVVQGVGLANGAPTLEINGKAVEPNTKTDTEIRFSLPPYVSQEAKPLLIPAVLHLFEEKIPFLGFSHSLVPHTYPVRLAIYPHEIGPLTITPRRRVSQTESVNRTSSNYRCESPHGEGSNSTPAHLVPDSGYTMKGLAFHQTYSNSGTFTMNTTSPFGSTGTLSCSGFGRGFMDAGQVGVEEGYFTWEDKKEKSVLQNDPARQLSLHWGESIVVSDLPLDTETILFELRPFTGEPQLDLQGSGANRFARFDFDGTSKVATVTARDIEQVLRQ